MPFGTRCFSTCDGAYPSNTLPLAWSGWRVTGEGKNQAYPVYIEMKVVASPSANSFIRRASRAKRTAMQITVLGFVLIPLSLLWAFQPGSPVAAFAVRVRLCRRCGFDIRGIWPATGYGAGIAIYCLHIFAIRNGHALPRGGSRNSRGIPDAVAAVLCVDVSMAVAACIFWRCVCRATEVGSPRSDPLTPLQPTFGNVTQALYLMINIIFMVAVAIFLTRSAIPYQSIIASYLLGGYVVVGLTFWQLGNRVAGIPFPDELLQSNPGWAIVTQVVGTVPRLQGPFSEPAALAGYMSGIALCCLWLSVRGYRIMRPNLLLGLAVSTTLLSTSTTGILTIVVGLPFTLALASVGGVPGALGRIGKTVSLLLLSGLLVIVPVFG